MSPVKAIIPAATVAGKARADLLAALDALPDTWALVPVKGKSPVEKDWQHNPRDKEYCRHAITRRRFTGVGVLCGPASGGLLFIDHDGASCDELIERLSGLPLADALPPTVTVTSGRPGRYQAIYYVSSERWDWDVLSTTKLKTGVCDDEGNTEQVELRWTGSQSVVIGAHPSGSVYRWLADPATVEIAPAPEWALLEASEAAASANVTGKFYSLPTPAPTAAAPPPTWAELSATFALPFDAVPPLFDALSLTSQGSIAQGAGAGSRNDTGAALARDLLGTAAYLEQIGQRYDGDARSLFDEFCACCSPPIAAREADQIWRSAEKSSPGAARSAEYIRGALMGWHWRQIKPAKADKVKADKPAAALRLVKPSPAATLPEATSAVGGDTDDKIWLSSDDTAASVALRELYNDCRDYVRIGDNLYRWAGTHYQICEERAERQRINSLLARCYAVKGRQDGTSTITRPWFTGSKVSDTYQAVLSAPRYIPPDKVNASGINCTNGVLIVRVVAGVPEFQLFPHSPGLVFTYPPQVEFNPEADSTACDGLLAAIDSRYRSAVLRVFAAAVDLPLVRQFRGRVIRSLIFTGDGNNGKDSLRNALSLIFGRSGITGCSIDDFQAYDHGRKFNLASLAGSRINWASENNLSINVDQIQCLKQLITGDPLVTEEKFRQGVEFTPRCISIFSTNTKTVNLVANLEAIASRYSIVPFTKKFVVNPTHSNELLADSRYAYDTDWVKQNVLPALLNYLVDGFKAIFSEGIDYSVFSEVMESNRLGAVHLFQFCNDAGIVPGEPTDFIPVETIWIELRKWYENEGYLSIGEKGDTWSDDPRPGDPLVKFAVKLKQRLERCFPTITSGQITSGINKGKKAIFGLKFATSEPPPVEPTPAPAATAPPAPTPPPAPAPAPATVPIMDDYGLYLTPEAEIDSELAVVEVELLDATTEADLARIKSAYNGSLTAVWQRWQADGRAAALTAKVAAIKSGGASYGRS